MPVRQRKKQSHSRSKKLAKNDESLVVHTSGTASSQAPASWIALSVNQWALICSVASLLLYANTYANLWAFDDIRAITTNRDVTVGTMTGIWTNDFWGTPLKTLKSHKSFRPLTTLTFRWNWILAPNNPHAFHIGNNVFNALAVYFVILALASIQEGKRRERHSRQKVNSFLVVSSLMFVFHPIHTEAVANIVGRAELLSASFAVAAFWCHQTFIVNDETRKRSPLHFGAVLGLAFASAFAKETGITVLAICGASEIANFWLPSTSAAAAGSRKDKGTRIDNELPTSVLRFVMLASTGITYLWIRRIINGEGGFGLRRVSQQDNPLLHAESESTYLLTALFVSAFYAWRLIYPMTLLCDYGYNTIPLVEGFGDVRNLATLGWALAMLCLAWKGLWRARQQLDSRLLLALAWIVAPLLPASHIIPIGTVLAERLLYLPSLGYAILIGLAFEWFTTGWGNNDEKNKVERKEVRKRSYYVTPLLLVVLVLFTRKILERNQEWKDNQTLWKVSYASHPQNVKVAANRARDLYDSGDLDASWKIASETYKLNPSYLANIIVLAKTTALTDAGQRDFKKAYSLLDEAVDIVESRRTPKNYDFEPYSAKGYLLSKEGRTDEARSWYGRAVDLASEVNPLLPRPHCNMGQIVAAQGGWEESIPHMEKCVDLSQRIGYSESSFIDDIENLGKAYYVTRQMDKAEEMLLRAKRIRQKPDVMEILDFLIDRNKEKTQSA